jgi:hypothetical protein
MTYSQPLRDLALLSIVTVAIATPRAAATQFIIDPTQSKISLSGSVIGNAVAEQGPGSLSTSFSGTIVANVTGAGIQFPGGSTLTAQTNGVWQPGPKGAAGSAPADYAGQANTILGSAKAALRNIVMDLTSSALPLTNGAFDASTLLFAFPTNSTASFDYDAGALIGHNGIPLSGNSTNKVAQGASLITAGNVQTLTIPIDAQFEFKALVENDSSVRFTGKLVATAGGSTTAPSISSITYTNQTVSLVVQGTGSTPRLDSTSDLLKWTTQTPTIKTNSSGTVLSLPATNQWQFYRVANP